MEEYIVEIEGYPNYAISNFGRVINTKFDWDLGPTPSASGYLKVQLYREGVRKDFYVHILVAEAFFADYEAGLEVKHISEDRTDNSVGNLRLGSKKVRQ